MKKKHKRQVLKYSIYKYLAKASLYISLISLLSVFIFILIRGIPYLNWQLIFGDYNHGPSIKPALIGTLFLVLIAVAIAAPIGIGSAIFLTEYTNSKSKLIKYIRVAVETLAGIPSIVYGIFGYLVFVKTFGLGYTILGGGITLAIMVLPVIVRSTEESLIAVPKTLREGSYALGSSKFRTIFSVVIPCASNGIITSLIISIGRIVSESAVLILTIGMVVNKMPEGLFSPGTSLALNVYYFGSHGYPKEAAATGVVVLIIILAINIIATVVNKLFGKGELVNG